MKKKYVTDLFMVKNLYSSNLERLKNHLNKFYDAILDFEEYDPNVPKYKTAYKVMKDKNIYMGSIYELKEE